MGLYEVDYCDNDGNLQTWTGTAEDSYDAEVQAELQESNFAYPLDTRRVD